jgi:hypothetical protein
MIVWAADVSVAEEVVRRRDAPTRKREYGPDQTSNQQMSLLSISPANTTVIRHVAKGS